MELPNRIGDKIEFVLPSGTFRIVKSRVDLYCLKHLERNDHARFGSKAEILSDVEHAKLTGVLPRPKVWGF
jgi:hypothetical protein